MPRIITDNAPYAFRRSFAGFGGGRGLYRRGSFRFDGSGRVST